MQLYITAKTLPGSKTFSVRLAQPIHIKEMALQTVAASSPPLAIPKKPYIFYINDEEYALPDRFFPFLMEVLAHIQANTRVKFYVSTWANSQNLVAIEDGQLAKFEAEPAFGSLYGIPTGTNGRCTLGSGFGRVVHLKRAPIVPPCALLYITNLVKKNELRPTERNAARFRLATLPVSLTEGMYINIPKGDLYMHAIGEEVREIEFALEWQDGEPYILQDQDISLVLHYT